MGVIPKIKWNELENMGKGKLVLGPLAVAIKNYCTGGYRNDGLVEVVEAYKKVCKKAPYEVATVDEFLNPKFVKALVQLVDKQFADYLSELVRLSADGQFSAGMHRRSYHSKDFGYYAVNALVNLRSWIRIHFYDHTIEELLNLDCTYVAGYDYFLALEINRGNEKIIDTIKDMILGENNTLLTRVVILGIIRSGNEELKDLILKLLLAAGGQEGLRQSVLESADAGSIDTFKRIFKCCLDNDIFRFTSAARALFTWLGLEIENLDINKTRKLAWTAWECLDDLEKRKEYLHSANPYDMYIAMWARGCEEIADTDQMAEELLLAEEKYKKLLGWYFVYNVESASYKHKHASSHLDEEDMCVMGAVTDCLYYIENVCHAYTYERKDYSPKAVPDSIFSEKVEERRALFMKLKEVAVKIGHGEWNYEGYLFPWSKMVVNQDNSNVLKCMFSLAAYDLDEFMIDELYKLQDLFSAELRGAFYIKFLDAQNNRKHRSYIWDGLKDRSIDNKLSAIDKLKNCTPCREDIIRISAMLKTKSAKIKKASVNYLKALDGENRVIAVEELLSGDENLIQAALELMIDDAALAEKYKARLDEIRASKLSDQTKILLEQLSPEEEQIEEKDNLAFGILDTAAAEKDLKKIQEALPNNYLNKKQILAMYPKEKEVEKLLDCLQDVFTRHADYEYEVERYGGERTKILFGYSDNSYLSYVEVPSEYGRSSELRQEGKLRLDMVPFANEFREVLAEYIADSVKLIMIIYLLSIFWNEKICSWIEPFYNNFKRDYRGFASARYKGMLGKLISILELALYESDQDAAYQAMSDLYFGLCHELGEDKLAEIAYEIYYRKAVAISMSMFREIHKIMGRLSVSDEMFSKHFLRMYALERTADYKIGDHISANHYFKAYDLGIISDTLLYDYLFHPQIDNSYLGVANLSSLKSINRRHYHVYYDWMPDISEKVLDAMVRFEAKRGQAETPITGRVRRIERIEGCDYFCLLLKALGKDNFFRGYQWSEDGTKSASLSSLLKKCWPAKEDTVEKLAALLKETDISEKRLVEAAMYAPQWAPFIEKIIGWEGLKKAVWFFHAHISERFSSEKETEVAIYSPITPQQFNDGMFDIAWFKESYAQMGEARFKQLYASAKYITNGSNAHRRSQLYADACTGKLDSKALEAEILGKRNQEKLRAYALLPVTEDTLLHRYEFIQKYIKDSRQFGAQRRESEKLAGLTAIENLAIASGYMDVNRMLWRLEKEKNEDIKPLMEKQDVSGYELSLVFDMYGNPDVLVEKDGKILKTVPKAIAKDEYLLNLKNTAKELRDQRERGKRTLENAMIDRTKFGVDELDNILTSFTIAPMAKLLVWKAGEQLGYLVQTESGVGLSDFEGKVTVLEKDVAISVAHPYHLFVAGCWSAYMHDTYVRQVVQPFKQIFREYYPMTEEEFSERTLSRRYAGYQVQPKKTVALLKGRGWTVDYEEGLQKVCYSDNLVVRMYAMADWFSPSDIEAPTLEVIQFFDRKNSTLKAMGDVDPVLFSEIMRDLDLVVSVAYVGGVEVETSHSTVQMRIALAKELIGFMKIGNVTFTDHHAVIAGKLAKYSVHMGSGIVHAEARGMLPILPVHSQHRGRIFLPFADEDPRTAEVMSKIILLAEDTKIKDPEILKFLK